MMRFENLGDLKTFLRSEAEKKAFSPVRFISVGSVADRIELVNFFRSLPVDFIFLSDFCSGADTFPNTKRLRNLLRRTTRSVCVLPLSELLRINPSCAEEEIRLLLSVTVYASCTFRFYFPMLGMENFFLAMNESDARQQKCVLALTPTVTRHYSPTIISMALRRDLKIEGADGIRQYLRFWETDSCPWTTLFTDKAECLRARGQFASTGAVVITSAYELLRRYHSLPVELEERFGSDAQWQELVTLIESAGSFERVICGEFRSAAFDVSLLDGFGSRSEFQRWLIWLQFKLRRVGYMAQCALQSSSPVEFVEQSFGLIFDYAGTDTFDEFCRERRVALSLMKCWPPADFIEKVRGAEKFLALRILTDSSLSELVLIFETLQRLVPVDVCEHGTGVDSEEKAVEILRDTCPMLAAYLSSTGIDNCAGDLNKEQADYFRRYRWLKVMDRLPVQFSRRVTEIAKRRGRDFFAMRSRNQIISDEYSESAAIFFVDALGVEYLGLIAYILAPLKNCCTVTYRIGRCNLPSVTENNKDFLTGRKVVGAEIALDTVKHGSAPYPMNIIGELKFFSELRERLLRAVEKNKKIILCADHGTSRLAVIARREKLDCVVPAGDRVVENNGRSASLKFDDDKIFPTGIEIDDKIIFADYSRFSRHGSVGNEVHGGAAWEEVFVPIVVIEVDNASQTHVDDRT